LSTEPQLKLRQHSTMKMVMIWVAEPSKFLSLPITVVVEELLLQPVEDKLPLSSLATLDSEQICTPSKSSSLVVVMLRMSESQWTKRLVVQKDSAMSSSLPLTLFPKLLSYTVLTLTGETLKSIPQKQDPVAEAEEAEAVVSVAEVSVEETEEVSVEVIAEVSVVVSEVVIVEVSVVVIVEVSVDAEAHSVDQLQYPQLTTAA